jgi:hypothetical protein
MSASTASQTVQSGSGSLLPHNTMGNIPGTDPFGYGCTRGQALGWSQALSIRLA